MRLSFMRANPKYGTYDNKRRILPLPGCLEEMPQYVHPRQRQAGQVAALPRGAPNDAERQAVLDEYDRELRYWFSRCAPHPHASSKSNVHVDGGLPRASRAAI